jgi:hypothetical protein
MALPYRQERLLRRVERGLCRSDPALASMLSMFARVSAAERMPAREQLRSRLAWAWRGLLGPAAAASHLLVVFTVYLFVCAVFLLVCVGGGGSRAASSCTATPRRFAGEFWETRWNGRLE